MSGRDLMIALDDRDLARKERDRAQQELEQLRRSVLLDCQPKSKEDAVYVSIKWRDRILQLANAPVTPNLRKGSR